MASRIERVSISGDVADLRKQRSRLTKAVTGSQMPKPAKDLFTVAATPAADYPLTSNPLTSDLGSSLVLSWGPLVQVEGTDYTVDYDTGIVTLDSSIVDLLTPGDAVYAEYWTTGELVAGTPARALEVFTNDASTLDLGQALNAGEIVLLNCGKDSTPSGLGCTWVLLDRLSWYSDLSGSALWLGYGGATGQTISLDVHSGMHAFIFADTAGDASAVVAHSATTIVGGDIRTDPIAPTADGQTVFGYLVIGDSVIGSTPAWTSTPTGWVPSLYGYAVGGTFSGGGFNVDGPVGSTAYRSTGESAGAYTYGRWGVVLA